MGKKLRVVTGFIPLPGHPRSVEEYERLGARLQEFGQCLDQKILLFLGGVEDTWLHTYLADSGIEVSVAYADNQKKNTGEYHCVQHQKTEWLWKASEVDLQSDVFVWIDYGIFSVPGVTEAAIATMLGRAQHETSVCIPGCWQKDAVEHPNYPNWRFCGGLIVCPRQYTFALDIAMKAECLRHIRKTGRLTWEVNTLARVEASGDVPIWHYTADHNVTMFANYPKHVPIAQ